MNLQQATFANGCFWCTEAVFQSLKGVSSVTSGYTGGKSENPSYVEICNGGTGHAEAIEINYDADLISYNELLLIFFKTHNPTTLNHQGSDNGMQYRSAVFYHTVGQKHQAIAMIKRLEEEEILDNAIVTQVLPAGVFYAAEDHHQNYYNKNNLKHYCVHIIQPKLNRLAKEFTDKIKPELL